MVGIPPQVTGNELDEIQAIIQAISNGQDVKNFDAQTISAAKQYAVQKANELNAMINSSNLPPNVSREMLRNDLSMYQGMADKLAEDDEVFATAMDAAFIGAGLYTAAKYGPMAIAKAKTMGQNTYGFAQRTAGSAAESIRNIPGSVRAGAAGAANYARDFASRAAEYATSGTQEMNQAIRPPAPGSGNIPYPDEQTVRSNQYAYDRSGAGRATPDPPMRGATTSRTPGRFQQWASPTAQRTFGFGQNLASGAGKAIRRLFRIPF
mgnify:CR=1 FL=1